MAPPTTTIRKCPSCGAPVRLADGEDEARCEACNSLVLRGAETDAAAIQRTPSESAGDVPRGAIALLAVVLVLLVGLYGVREYKRRVAATSRAPKTTPAAPVLDVAPARPVGPAADAIAWEAEARAPLLVAADDDDIEDVLGFFRAWDGRSAWISYAGVFRGKDLSPVWRSEPLDPWIVRRGEGVVPSALAVGKHAVIADTGDTLRIYNLATGELESALKLGGDAVELCRAPDPAQRVWVRVDGTHDALIDVGVAKSAHAARPAWCPAPSTPPAALAVDAGKAADTAVRAWLACHDDFRNPLALAACGSPDGVPTASGFAPHFVLRSEKWSVAIGTKDGDGSVPMALAYGERGAVAWQKGLAADESSSAPTKGTEGTPHVAELASGELYVVYDKVYFDERLTSLDAKTGERRWDVPIAGSLARVGGREDRGVAKAIVVGGQRVYVPRSGGSLDVYDQKDGKLVGSIGKQ